MNIAFIGLGRMGYCMAINLMKGGYAVTGFDISRQVQEQAALHGLHVAASAHEAVQKADVVITMLSGNKSLEHLMIGDQLQSGLLQRLPKGALLIDSGTTSPHITQNLYRRAVSEGIDYLDAPVFGGQHGAQDASLTFMVGGAFDVLERARPLLKTMGANIVHTGKVGTGQVAKLCIHLRLAVTMIGTAESLTLADAHGITPVIMTELIEYCAASRSVIEDYNPVPGVKEQAPSSHDYQGSFTTDQMLADLGLAVRLAASIQTPLPLGGIACNMYNMHSLTGYRRKDFSSIIKMFEKMEEIEL